MTARRFGSRAAAERVAANIRNTIPQADVRIEKDLSITIIAYESVLSPSQRNLAAGHRLKAPERPNPATPMFHTPKRKRRAEQDQSTVERPSEICDEIFKIHLAAGTLDDRARVLQEVVDQGVSKNTAKTYYWRFRADRGLAQVRTLRAKKSRAKVGGKRPAGRQVQNGIAEPVEGSISREVWDTCKALHSRYDRPPRLGEVRQRLPEVSINTVQKYYQRWRKFNDIPPQPQFHDRS